MSAGVLGRTGAGSNIAGDLDDGQEVSCNVSQRHRGVVDGLLVSGGDLGGQGMELAGNLDRDLHRLVVFVQLAVLVRVGQIAELGHAALLENVDDPLKGAGCKNASRLGRQVHLTRFAVDELVAEVAIRGLDQVFRDSGPWPLRATSTRPEAMEEPGSNFSSMGLDLGRAGHDPSGLGRKPAPAARGAA